MRMLVANEPRVGRSALAGTLQALRPHVHVVCVEPDDLDAQIVRLAPDLVICSEPTEVLQTRIAAYIMLSPDGKTQATASIAGHQGSFDDTTLESFLSFIDQMAQIQAP